MTTITLPSTLTAKARSVLDVDAEPAMTYCVTLYWGASEVASWPIGYEKFRMLDDNAARLEAFVADKLAALFAPTVTPSGCTCGPQQ